MNKIFAISLIVVLIFSVNQSKCQVGIGTNNPNENSILDLSSASKGILIPRVDFLSLPQHPPSSPGLMVYVLENGPEGDNAFYFYNSSVWKRLDLPAEISWNRITETPETLAGYGITDAMSKEGFAACGSDFIGTTNAMPLIMKANNEEAMRISPDGKIGFGTTNPTATVTITSEGSLNPLKLENLQTSTPPEDDFLVVDLDGNVSRRPNALGGLNSVITYASLLSVPEINNNSSYQVTIQVPGAQTGAGVVVGPEADLSSVGGTVVIQAWVQSTGYVSVKWSNVKNEKANPPTTIYHFLIFQ